jgi:hypothetical protein
MNFSIWHEFTQNHKKVKALVPNTTGAKHRYFL